jgi:hypothetical protein
MAPILPETGAECAGSVPHGESRNRRRHAARGARGHGSFLGGSRLLSHPVASVTGAGTTQPPSFWESLKLIGSNLPSLLMAGTFLYHGDVVFFDYSGKDEILVVDLTGSRYKHLFVHVDPPDTPAAAAQRIQAALAAASAPPA